MQEIKFGPAGIGGFIEAQKNLEYFREKGIKCAEIPFTYGIWLTNDKASILGEIAKKNEIELTIHAPYYINLNSKEENKVKESMKRILLCCERAHYLKAKHVVFHAAYYGKNSEEEVYKIVKKKIIEMQDIIRKKRWEVSLAPETTGKRSQFGSLQELLKLHKETGCFFCVDFAHLEARNGKENYQEILEELKKEKIKRLHCHFSGIIYSKKGEQKHVTTPNDKIKELLLALIKSKISANIINESPTPLEDSIKSINILKEILR